MDNRRPGTSNIAYHSTNITWKWIIKHIRIQIWLWYPNWKEQRGRLHIPIWPHFSFLVLLFLFPCDVAIPAYLLCHNSAQISLSVYRTHTAGNNILRAHLDPITGLLAQSNRVPPSTAPLIETNMERCYKKGISLSIHYVLKLQMSPTSTLRATQIRCSTSMRTASFARSFR